MAVDTEVLIVGAGPVGLVIALVIAKEGINVTVIERFSEVIQSPRAMAYGPAAVNELERAGIADDCRKIGMEECDYTVEIRWITKDNKKICGFERPAGGHPPVICGQHRVAEVILNHMAKYPNAKVLWDHAFKSVKENGDSATVTCETKDGDKEITARYVVGADGATSSVRKAIGCTFDGFTYDKMVVATNVYYPFRENGFGLAQFIVDPEHFALIAKCAPDGMYRCSYGEDASLSLDEARAKLDEKYNQMFPGPKPVTGKYDLRMFSPYKLHQRCSSKFRVGSVLLAGDAAHACNPFGGMGLTTGLCDAGGLADCLIGVLRRGCGDDLLDKYAQIRREKFLKVTDPVSRANVERLFKTNPETAAEDDPFLKVMAEKGHTPEFQQQMADNMLALAYDFTQYYPQQKVTTGVGIA